MQAVVARIHDDGAGGGRGRSRTLSSSSGLSMYAKQPAEELTLYDFEVIALNRLRGEMRRPHPGAGG